MRIEEEEAGGTRREVRTCRRVFRCIHTVLAWSSQAGAVLKKNLLRMHLICFMCLQDWEREGFGRAFQLEPV